MKKWAILGLVLFPLALGVVAGLRLSEESLAVVVGLILGLGASLPLYFLAFFLVKRAMAKEERAQNHSQASPPVIVVNPGGVHYPQPPIYLPPTEGEGGLWGENRYFRVIGENWEKWD